MEIVLEAAGLSVALFIVLSAVAYVSHKIGYERGIKNGEYNLAKKLITAKFVKKETLNKSDTAKEMETVKIPVEEADKDLLKKAIIRDKAGKSTLEYKGYIGSIRYDAKTDSYKGTVQGVKGRKTYSGETIDDLSDAFARLIDSGILERI